jgi:hypothetical protein
MTVRAIRRIDVQDYLGQSTDTKPTLNVMPGALFYETDTGAVYLWTGDVTQGSSGDWVSWGTA